MYNVYIEWCEVLMNLDYVNDLFAMASEESRDARITNEYHMMLWEINDRYFAEMQADLDAMDFGRAA